MPELTIVSFNSHAGLRARRNGVCEPYDLAAVLRGLDADVIVLQESWTPDGDDAAVREVAAELGAILFEKPFGRAPLAPSPPIPRAPAPRAPGPASPAPPAAAPARPPDHRRRRLQLLGPRRRGVPSGLAPRGAG